VRRRPALPALRVRLTENLRGTEPCHLRPKPIAGLRYFNPKISLPKFAVPGKCWQGYFQDPEGNTFGVFEVDERAGR
jgi:hypothetical protein